MIDAKRLPTVVVVTFVIALTGLLTAGFSVLSLRGLSVVHSAIDHRIEQLTAGQARITELEAKLDALQAELEALKRAAPDPASP